MKFLAVAMAAAVAVSAHAHLGRWAYTYGWQTPSKGEIELELRNYLYEEGRQYKGALELEYGVTDRYMIAPYLLFETYPEGEGGQGGVHISGFKVEQIYRLGNYEEGKLLPALYLEYKKENDEENAELEGKLIVEMRKGEHEICANLILENELNETFQPEWGYTLGYSNTKIDPKKRFWGGFEALGNFTEREHWFGPSFGTYIGDHMGLIITYAASLSGEGDQAQIKLSYEF